MEMLSVAKKGKVNYDAAVKQVDLILPDSYKEPTKHALSVCRETGKGVKDYCEAGYLIAKCMHDANPYFGYPEAAR